MVMRGEGSLGVVRKDPDETLDYLVDWGPFLGADTIASVSWEVPAGLTKGAETNTTTTATVWLSGGVVGHEDYIVVCNIVSSVGRAASRSFAVHIEHR